ncbi:MAG: sugar kinase [Chitinophagaceae bacterium]|nr:sugar kinase [Chitinophagaceae bacterium]
MKKVLSFGDILLRLSPDANGEWIDKNAMPVYLGGAELNVAHALARWNIPVAYCSAAPSNYLSGAILEKLQSHGIDTSRMITSGDRIGIYYLAQGTDLKNAGVIYDRANSSTALLQRGQVDWDDILKDISWFHFSAISPAISENLAAVCEEALQAARKKNIFISVDLNYRAKLWKWNKEPHEVMPALVKYCDLVMGNIWAIEKMLGIKLDSDFKAEKDICIRQSQKSSEEVMKKFPQCKQVANTFRFDEGSKLRYYSTLFTKNGLTVSGEHDVADIVDKVGSGDCFMGGLIYGNLNSLSEKDMLEFATAAAVDKMYVMGDATTSTPKQIKARIKN